MEKMRRLVQWNLAELLLIFFFFVGLILLVVVWREHVFWTPSWTNVVLATYATGSYALGVMFCVTCAVREIRKTLQYLRRTNDEVELALARLEMKEEEA